MAIDRILFAQRYVARVADALHSLPWEQVDRAVALLENTLRTGRTVFLAGNGGSAATADHMANDLMKGAAKTGGAGFRAISLAANGSVLSAIANDQAYSEVFASQLAVLGRKDDVLIVISGSGSSPNVIRAVQQAWDMGIHSIGLLGMDGGKLAPMVEVAVTVPSCEYGPIEDAHLVLDHLITSYFQELCIARAGESE